MILSRRPNDDDRRDGFTKWPFMTTHTWGEYPWGEWILEVNNNYIKLFYFKIHLYKSLKTHFQASATKIEVFIHF